MKLVKVFRKNAGFFSGLAEEGLLSAPMVLGVGCVNEEEAMGLALLDVDTESRLLIRSFFVPPAFRRQGAGSFLLSGVLEMAEVAEADTVEAFFLEREAQRFFLSNGFLVSNGLPVYKIRAKELLSSDVMEQFKVYGKNCVSVRRLDPIQRKELSGLLRESGYSYEISPLQEMMSFAYLSGGKHPTACILVSFRKETHTLWVDYLINSNPDEPHHTAELVAVVAEEARVVFPEDTVVAFVEANGGVREFIRRLAGREKKLKKSETVKHAVKAVKSL